MCFFDRVQSSTHKSVYIKLKIYFNCNVSYSRHASYNYWPLKVKQIMFITLKVEHTTVMGLALSDILKDAKHKLKPWELSRHKNIRGLRKAKVPQLSYSHVYCFYKVSNNVNLDR